MEVRKGYKQTEVGIIPSDWEVKPLNELVQFANGKAHENYIKDDGKYIVANSKFISSEGVVKKYSDVCLSPTEAENILMVMSDVPNGKAIAKCFFVDKNNNYTVNQRICSLKVKNDHPKFLFYIINRNRYYLTFDDGVNQTNLRKNDVLGYPIPLPPTKAEQTAIANALSDTDALISSLEKLIAKRRNIKHGTMQELLTGKTRLPGFSGEWEVKKLGEIFSISAGGDLIKETFSPIKDSKYCYPIYSNSLINKGLYGFSELYRHDENCITVTARGTIGVANVRDHKFDAIGRVLVLKPICELNCLFVSEYLNHRVNFSIESTGVPQLTAPQVSKYQIAFPKPTEQSAIAQIFSDMDAEIDALEKKLTKYRMIKHGMMQELLTGKTRLV